MLIQIHIPIHGHRRTHACIDYCAGMYIHIYICMYTLHAHLHAHIHVHICAFVHMHNRNSYLSSGMYLSSIPRYTQYICAPIHTVVLFVLRLSVYGTTQLVITHGLNSARNGMRSQAILVSHLAPHHDRKISPISARLSSGIRLNTHT